MRPIPLLLAALGGAASLAVVACTTGDTPLGPTSATIAPSGNAVGSGPTAVAGTFDAIVDFSTLTLTPRGQNCRLEVDGQLVFHGAIEGTAVGHTSALVAATCEQVASEPPGTDSDVFESVLVFDGTVNGEPAHADVRYAGGVDPGGHIDGRIIFSNGVAGHLEASSQVAVGGTYSGSVVVR